MTHAAIRDQAFPIHAAPAERSRAAIAEAAQATGVDFDYLLAQAKLESALDPGAKAKTSSAAGLFQFISDTWLDTLDKHGERLGLGDAAQRVDDPAARGALLALRFNPQASALMAGALASDNRAALTGVLGRAPDASELYLAHFLGAEGASRFLTALGRDPSTPAAAILPKAAAANRAIFHQPGGAPRSLAEVMDLIRTKMATAMEGETGFALPPSGFRPSSFAEARAPAQPDQPETPRPSMAQTLRASFGDDGSPAARHVRSAYARLEAFGL